MPLKTSSTLPPASDLTATWRFIEAGVELMMSKNRTGITNARYMGVYTAIYNYCISSRLVTAGDATGLGNAGRSGAQLMGSDLYDSLNKYLVAHLRSIQREASKLTNEELLKFYTNEWDRYTTGALYVNRLFTYLNRHWVKREKDEGRKKVYTIYTLALVKWRDTLFEQVQSSKGLTNALFKVIEKQRNGETVDNNLIKRATDSFVALGIDETDANRQNLAIYKSAFETAFLVDTERYYRLESESFIANNSMTDYMKKAEGRLKEEEDRIEMLLHPSSRREIVMTCEKALVLAHAEAMQEQFQTLLDNERLDDLRRMFKLLSRIPDGLSPLRQRFEVHVKKAGQDAVERVAAQAEGIDAKAYCDVLLDVYRRNTCLSTEAFAGDPGFSAALDKACREFVNRNKACAGSSTKSPELLAKYADSLLKKTSKAGEESDVEAALLDVMTIFKFIEDKDVFQKFYSKFLAKRLVHGASASDDSEENMISKLKDACGFEYTSKLQRMFQDMALNKDLNDAFKERMANSESSAMLVDFSVLVLSTAAWPLSAGPTDLKLPAELLKTFERFKSFYDTKHTGRKLNWLWTHCKNELRTTYTAQKYTLMTSTYQTAILLQFNTNGDEMDYADIQAATNLDKEILSNILSNFVKQKILEVSGDRYSLNLHYKSKKIRVNLNAPLKSETKTEAAEVIKTVDEDRKHLIQAVIVRIMKSRKEMKHQPLIAEAIDQLKARFTPKVPAIKQAIDHLMEQEYLERTEVSLACKMGYESSFHRISEPDAWQLPPDRLLDIAASHVTQFAQAIVWRMSVPLPGPMGEPAVGLRMQHLPVLDLQQRPAAVLPAGPSTSTFAALPAPLQSGQLSKSQSPHALAHSPSGKPSGAHPRNQPLEDLLPEREALLSESLLPETECVFVTGRLRVPSTLRSCPIMGCRYAPPHLFVQSSDVRRHLESQAHQLPVHRPSQDAGSGFGKNRSTPRAKPKPKGKTKEEDGEQPSSLSGSQTFAHPPNYVQQSHYEHEREAHQRHYLGYSQGPPMDQHAYTQTVAHPGHQAPQSWQNGSAVPPLMNEHLAQTAHMPPVYDMPPSPSNPLTQSEQLASSGALIPKPDSWPALEAALSTEASLFSARDCDESCVAFLRHTQASLAGTSLPDDFINQMSQQFDIVVHDTAPRDRMLWHIDLRQGSLAPGHLMGIGNDDDMTAGIGWWRKHLHPTDAQAAVLSLVASMATPSLHFWSWRYRLCPPAHGQTYLRVFDRVFIYRSQAGNPIFAVGVLHEEDQVSWETNLGADIPHRYNFLQHCGRLLSLPNRFVPPAIPLAGVIAQ
ncbi:uncharacterized protein L969DRAFT_78791 [Mixia osmundae IAM 14324]|uniref:uncharacterized protein n=1 Tax=Mixia osmundae (strain CBS 9802 / IAM 14324 / JCM 22182 / KY 12970) TaxID=764103 RepID=UPI0004A54F9E|nr:uncharacterized protein L969DRAFT_78791 [Mixia osmundae IAM 14324]KEI37061.1 hypothetical protein L969DRAFT_78791 [Mixia osmundae IAM 14324]